MSMPEGIAHLLNYGALGVFSAFVLWSLIQGGRWCFSRDERQPGLITLYAQARVRREEKMSVFLDTLTDHETVRLEREVKQQELCAQHNQGLVEIGSNLADHHVATRDACHTVQVLHDAAREACNFARAMIDHQPIDQQTAAARLLRIEQVLDRTREAG